MFTERGVGPLKGLSALIVDDVSSILGDEAHLATLVDLVVLIYNQLSNPGEEASTTSSATQVRRHLQPAQQPRPRARASATCPHVHVRRPRVLTCTCVGHVSSRARASATCPHVHVRRPRVLTCTCVGHVFSRARASATCSHVHVRRPRVLTCTCVGHVSSRARASATCPHVHVRRPRVLTCTCVGHMSSHAQRLNKVLMVHHIYEKDVTTAQELFSTEFTLVGTVKEAEKDELAEFLASSPDVSKTKPGPGDNSSDGDSEELKKVIKSSRVSTISKRGTKRGGGNSSGSSFCTSSENEDESPLEQAARYANEKKRRVKRSRSRVSTKSRSPKSHVKPKKDGEAAVASKEPDRSMLTPQLFLTEEKELRAEHEQEYNVFKEVPEMHPEYEAKYELFMTCYRQRMVGSQSDPDLEESVWNAYWAEELEKLKQKEWEAKRKELVTKYKKVLNKKKKTTADVAERISSETSVAGTSMLDNDSMSSDSVLMQSLAFATNAAESDVFAKTSSLIEPVLRKNSFSFEKAFRVIEDLCDSLGILGTALKGFLGIAKDKNMNTPEGLKIFTDADNVALFKMVIERWRGQLKSSPTQSISERLQEGIKAAENVLQEAQQRLNTHEPPVTIHPVASVVTSRAATSTMRTSGPVVGQASATPDKKNSTTTGKIIMDDIDMDSIARATLGKNPGEVLNFINNTLAYDGKSVNNEELTAIYLSISALHMSMSLQNKPPPSSALSSPPISYSSYASARSIAPSSSYRDVKNDSKSSTSSSHPTEETFSSSLSMPLKLPSGSQTANDILMASMSESLGDTFLLGLPGSNEHLNSNQRHSSVNPGNSSVNTGNLRRISGDIYVKPSNSRVNSGPAVENPGHITENPSPYSASSAYSPTIPSCSSTASYLKYDKVKQETRSSIADKDDSWFPLSNQNRPKCLKLSVSHFRTDCVEVQQTCPGCDEMESLGDLLVFSGRSIMCHRSSLTVYCTVQILTVYCTV
ncbi:hypothetical protein FHG87_014890 [Trinorchestia longiramus]|nr:hypothetical protein FHG87_014890 [Trinorchestia longiramus]